MNILIEINDLKDKICYADKRWKAIYMATGDVAGKLKRNLKTKWILKVNPSGQYLVNGIFQQANKRKLSIPQKN